MIPMMKISCISSFLLLFAFQSTVSTPIVGDLLKGVLGGGSTSDAVGGSTNVLSGLLSGILSGGGNTGKVDGGSTDVVSGLLSGILPGGGSTDPVSGVLPDLGTGILPGGGSLNIVSALLNTLLLGLKPSDITELIPGTIPGNTGGLLSGVVPILGGVLGQLSQILSGLLSIPGVPPVGTPGQYPDLNITVVIKRPKKCCPSCPKCEKTCSTCQKCEECPDPAAECSKPDPASPCNPPSDETLATECSKIGGFYCIPTKSCFHSRQFKDFKTAKSTCSSSSTNPFCHKIAEPGDFSSPEAQSCLTKFLSGPTLSPTDLFWVKSEPEGGSCKIMKFAVEPFSVTVVESEETALCSEENNFFCIASTPENNAGTA